MRGEHEHKEAESGEKNKADPVLCPQKRLGTLSNDLVNCLELFIRILFVVADLAKTLAVLGRGLRIERDLRHL